jgi:2-polyprenyl-3-methyl-5-hydroxy-6-metoxy-1,4-benzoquinol methylase
MFRCFACKNEKVSAHIICGPLKYNKCQKCGLETQFFSEASSVYDTFDKNQIDFYDADDLSFIPSIRLICNVRAKKRIKLVKKYVNKGLLLEIGPGTGELLVAARASGFHVEAIEESEKFKNYLASLNINVFPGMLENSHLNENNYDILISSHVIEHVPDPITHLSIARDLVKKGGYICIFTPNVECWEHSVAGNSWAMYSQAHMQLFSCLSLISVLKQAGWEITDIKTLDYAEDWLRVIPSLLSRKVDKSDSGSRSSAGGRIRKIPFWLFSFVLKLVSIILWPLCTLQSSLKKGGDLMIIARRPVS